MIKLKYVGLKADGERAFQHDTGIEWFPGSRHEVSDQMAAKMLKHPDVFAVDDEQPEAPAKSLQLSDAKVPAPTVNLKDLDKAALHALAKERGVKVHHAAGAETVRTALEAAQ